MLASGTRDVVTGGLIKPRHDLPFIKSLDQQSTLLDSFDSIEIIQQSQGVSNNLEILEATLEIFGKIVNDYCKFTILLYTALEIFEILEARLLQTP